MTKVALTGTNDSTTITPSATTGLMVYNTATAGAAGFEVIPGFYYWNGTKWRSFYNQGYTLNYTQTAQATASSNNRTYVTLPGLDTGSITVPFTGTYQIRVEAFYSAGNLISTAGDGAAQGSISLAQATGGGPLNMIKETYLTTSSKRLGSTTVNNLAQSATILWNLKLTAGVTYQFAVRGREWLANNVGTGTFGKNTSGYSGSGINDAQRGTMTITLIKQL
ncbi:hypothetical protein GCM10008083_33600 [Ulvibacter litoralis]|nr:hypothetical protein GCM10008083_33600 [Ulvibacter litoralis]